MTDTLSYNICTKHVLDMAICVKLDLGAYTYEEAGVHARLYINPIKGAYTSS